LLEHIGENPDVEMINRLAYTGARTIYALVNPKPRPKRPKDPLRCKIGRLEGKVKEVRATLSRLINELNRQDWRLPVTPRQGWTRRKLQLRKNTKQRLNCLIEKHKELLKIKQSRLREANTKPKQHLQRDRFNIGGPNKALTGKCLDNQSIHPDPAVVEEFWGNLLGVEGQCNKYH